MNPERPGTIPTKGFTLLELVVVLAILGVLTSMAVVAVDGAADRARADQSNALLDDLRAAIGGSQDDSGADGRPSVGGFVADMGRAPVGVLVDGRWTLAELWTAPPAPQRHALRTATVEHGVETGDVDPEVLVAGGWRGPYLRLGAGVDSLRDGWGNPMASPQSGAPDDPLAAAYPRLRTNEDFPIDGPGQGIGVIRHLGANGRFDPLDAGWDRDVELRVSDPDFLASAGGQVDILDADGNPLPASPGTPVVIRVYGPDPADASKIKVYKTTLNFATNPLVWTIPSSPALGPTIGPRVARAILGSAAPSATPPGSKSAVKQIVLRPGANAIHFRIQP